MLHGDVCSSRRAVTFMRRAVTFMRRAVTFCTMCVWLPAPPPSPKLHLYGPPCLRGACFQSSLKAASWALVLTLPQIKLNPQLLGCAFFFFTFQGCTCSIWRFPDQGLNRSCSCRPTPQPQQRQIQAVSATYTTAHGNAGSLTH